MFESQKEFEDFETIIQNKCLATKLEIIKREETDYWAPFDPYEFYRCKLCAEIWVLRIPENTSSGFFLTEKEGLKYTKELEEKKRIRRIGFLTFLIVIVLVIVWKLVG